MPLPEERVEVPRMLFRATPGVSHWHVDVFCGPTRTMRAKAGTLTMHADEAQELLSMAAMRGHDAVIRVAGGEIRAG